MSRTNSHSPVPAATRLQAQPRRLTKAELLAPIARWDVNAKAQILNGVQNGIITKEEACEAHVISAEEFATLWSRWCDLLAGDLRATVKTRRRV